MASLLDKGFAKDLHSMTTDRSSATKPSAGHAAKMVYSLPRKGLPLELQWMIVERMSRDASIRDWVSVWQVSQGWRKHTPVAFTEWLKSQAEGVQFGHFAGSKREVRFVMSHMQVLKDQKVSLTLIVDAGRTGWFLTKESGRVPLCDDRGCVCRHTVLLEERRRSYMVLEVRDSQEHRNQTFNIFAELSSLRLQVMAKQMLPQMALLRRQGEGLAFRVSIWMWQGRFWSEVCAGCSVSSGVCKTCRIVYREAGSRLPMVTQKSFKGPFPNARAQWWTGITDAAWDSNTGRVERWLCCPQRRRPEN